MEVWRLTIQNVTVVSFEGVGMQYGLGFLANYDYHYFKHAVEEKYVVFIVSLIATTVTCLSSVQQTIHGRDVMLPTLQLVMKEVTDSVKLARLDGYLHGTCQVCGMHMRSHGSKRHLRVQ